MRQIIAGTLVLLIALVGLTAYADTLTLKDGSTLAGRVVPQGDRYWVKLESGETKLIPKIDVITWNRAPAPTPGAAAAGTAAPATPTPAVGGSAAPRTAATAGFSETKSKADRVDAPLAAVGMWQAFIDNNAGSADLPAANAELEKWKKLDADKAEKINGKWLGGEDRKKLIGKVKDLLNEANQLEGSQTLKAVAKLEEAVKLYPNSFDANFQLGYLYLVKAGTGSLQKHDQAIKSLETATKLRPNSAAAWSNLGIAYNFRQRYEQSVLACYKGAQLKDTKEITQNLINSIAQAPPGMRANNAKVRPIMEEATLLARKHGVGDGKQAWAYVNPRAGGKEDKGAPSEIDDDSTPGLIGNGSGFLVSADGYLLTNRHVAAEKNCTFMCRFADGTQKSATVIAIDDVADIALLKIKSDKPFPYLQLAKSDEPPTGAECAALGFPVGHVMNYTMQVTAGTISSVSPADPYAVTLTAKITHGNSGGPLVDKYGNVIGVVSAGLTAYSETYGKALSAGQVRKFLDKNKDKLPVALIAGPATEKLDTEQIYKKASPATMCILLIRGDAKPE
jgi:S1-C subfamily serine protease